MPEMSEALDHQQSPSRPEKSRDTTQLFRACRFLFPYRRWVVTSIVCALFVGGVTTVGLSAMLPVLRVLLNYDTLQGWADRQIRSRWRSTFSGASAWPSSESPLLATSRTPREVAQGATVSTQRTDGLVSTRVGA